MKTMHTTTWIKQSGHQPQGSLAHPSEQKPSLNSEMESNKEEWLISFVDVLLLLLTLFILLFALTKAQLGPIHEEALPPAETTALPSAIQDVYENFQSLNNVHATLHNEAVNIEIRSSILFRAGSAQIEKHAHKLFDELLLRLPDAYAYISIEGHTDNTTISTPLYPSNWELSSARASNVVKLLIEKGVSANKLRAVGYADTRPLTDNATKKARERNRRVTIIVHLKENRVFQST